VKEPPALALIDSHCHLTYSPLSDDVAAVMARARAAGVTAAITIGTDAEDARAAVDLAAEHQGVFAAIGVHPHEAGKATEGSFATILELYGRQKVVAAGEMGLDYHYVFSDRASQRRVFEQQISMALSADLPIVIHSRKAFEDTVAVLRAGGCEGRPVVFHCFGGSAEEFAVLDRFGWRGSFTGSVTFKNARAMQALVREYPADRLMIETDSPYLTPEPIRSFKPNEPAYVRLVGEFLATLRGVDARTLAEQMTRNTIAFFRLPASAATAN
jgi:TatD DNase family protein